MLLLWCILRFFCVAAGAVATPAYVPIVEQEFIQGHRPTWRRNRFGLKLFAFGILLLAVTTSAWSPNIKWSPTAQQQVRDWANGGGDQWQHTIQRGGLGQARVH